MTYGMDARVGICFQNSFGTSLTSSLHWLQTTAENISLKKEQIVRQGMRGIYDEGAYQEGKNTIDGDVTIEAIPNDLGVLLKATMNLVSTVTSSAVRTHTFRPRTADWDGLSAEQPFTYAKFMGDVGSMNLYGDLNGKTLELACSNGELLTAKLGVIGGRFTQIAAIAATYATSAALDWSVSSVSIGGTGKVNVRDLTITQENNLEAKHTLGTAKTPQRNKRSGNRTLTVAGTLCFDDQTDFQTFISQSEQRMLFNFKSAWEIQSGYSEELLIDMPAFRFTEFPQEIGGPGEIEVGFQGMANYHPGSGNSVTVTLRNSKAY